MSKSITECIFYTQDGDRCRKAIRGHDMCYYHYDKLLFTKCSFTRLSKSDIENINTYYEKGLSANQVAKKIGCSKQTVLRHCKASGIVRKEEKSQGTKYIKVKRGRYSGKKSKTPWLRRLNTNSKYKEFRKNMFARDKWTCQWCGYKGSHIQLDHILPKSVYPELVYAESNVRTLCVDCHRKTDSYAGRALKNYRRELA